MSKNGFLIGDRIYLREVRKSDVNENYYNWLADTEVNQYLETKYVPQSLENISSFVASMDGKREEILLAICDIETETHIGNIKIGPINWLHRFADISLLIGDKNFWGKGYATEAIGMVTDFAFLRINLLKVKAGCYSANEGSARAFEKVGFVREGLLNKLWVINGEYQDEILLGYHIDDWRVSNRHFLKNIKPAWIK
ncbi:MAG: GNAT family protein [Bacteroidota bacterium]|nr:GNAT family protein [Bacteroidota bacterium]